MLYIKLFIGPSHFQQENRNAFFKPSIYEEVSFNHYVFDLSYTCLKVYITIGKTTCHRGVGCGNGIVQRNTCVAKLTHC